MPTATAIIPNLRRPGGCSADEYHWRDGLGPRARRPRMAPRVQHQADGDGVRVTDRGLELTLPPHSFVTVQAPMTVAD
ncbi:hypothetical protein [Streptomyces puniciscabiei]|uniref:hypothetical protein n=1 Tax=Streptomyces puniciscabiei TaxID=164348 RepID=UPI0006EBDAC6|nr:hypothetical protein [Streptomyces puniciscabiei]